MPIYEYRCSSCGLQQEHLQKLSDPLISICPQCGKPDYKKQLTAAGFQLKGSGWYATDFKGGGKAKPESKVGATGESKDGPAKETAVAASSEKGAKDSGAGAPAPTAAAPSASSGS